MSMSVRELVQVPNLVSLSRIFMTPFIGYFLWRDDPLSTHLCIFILVLAGISDGLDGYLARRMNQISDLGKALDPLADKIMAAVLIILLILYREFPVWLAAVIVGRDLLIIVAGTILLRGKKVVVGSNLTGKYTFTAIVLLLVSYIYRFEFGIVMSTWVTVGLLTLSFILYFRVFYYLDKGLPAPEFHDRPLYKLLRVAGTICFSVLYVFKFIEFLMLYYLP